MQGKLQQYKIKFHAHDFGITVWCKILIGENMNKKHLLPVCIVIGLVMMACRFSGRAMATPTDEPNAAVESAVTSEPMVEEKTLNIPYKNVASVNPNLLSLDVYRAKDRSGLPVMIYVHGGAWSMGDKAAVGAKDSFFVQSGFVFVSINYRLSPEVQFPTHAEDVASSIAWVKNNITQYGGDPTRMFLMGHSAGAQLVALVSTDEHYLQAEGLELNDLKAVIPLDTQAYNLKAVIEDSQAEFQLYTSIFGTDPEGWEQASPDTYVAAGKGIPPMALAYSGGLMGEGNYTRQQAAEEFLAKLQAAGIESILVPASEKTHAQINEEFGVTGDYVTEDVMGFIQQIINADK